MEQCARLAGAISVLRFSDSGKGGRARRRPRAADSGSKAPAVHTLAHAPLPRGFRPREAHGGREEGSTARASRVLQPLDHLGNSVAVLEQQAGVSGEMGQVTGDLRGNGEQMTGFLELLRWHSGRRGPFDRLV